MKKIKLLTPILGLTSIATIAVPLTSCACGGEGEKTATLSIIEIKTPATTLNFESGQTFSSAGLVLTATYSNNTTKDISSGFTTNFDGKTFSDDDIADNKEVTVTYKDNNVTKTVTYKINVTFKTIKMYEPTGSFFMLLCEGVEYGESGFINPIKFEAGKQYKLVINNVQDFSWPKEGKPLLVLGAAEESDPIDITKDQVVKVIHDGNDDTSKTVEHTISGTKWATLNWDGQSSTRATSGYKSGNVEIIVKPKSTFEGTFLCNYTTA